MFSNSKTFKPSVEKRFLHVALKAFLKRGFIFCTYGVRFIALPHLLIWSTYHSPT